MGTKQLKSISATIHHSKSKIFQDKGYAHCTDQFIEWCQDNPAKHVKLFSDLTQDVQVEGHTRVQLSASKKNTYHELAQYIFKNDTELSIDRLAKPQIFVTATQHCHNVYVFLFPTMVFQNNRFV